MNIHVKIVESTAPYGKKNFQILQTRVQTNTLLHIDKLIRTQYKNREKILGS